MDLLQIIQETISSLSYQTIFLTIGLLFVLLKLFYKPNKTPPGPWGFPIVGHLPFLSAGPHIKLTEWHKQFGDIYQIRMGTRKAIVINTLSLMKEAFLKQKGDFDSRPDFDSFKKIADGRSLAFGYHPQSWILQKKVMKTAMLLYNRDPNHAIKHFINEEGNRLVKDLIEAGKNDANNHVDPHRPIHLMASSVIYQMCYGPNKKPRESQEFQQLLQNTDEFSRIQGAGGNPGDVIPELAFLFKSRLRKFNELITLFGNLNRKIIEDVNASRKPEDGIRNMVDALNHVAKTIDQDDLTRSGMERNGFERNTSDLLGAAQATIVTVIRWFLLYVSIHPHVQDKMREEILTKIGPDSEIELSDRLKLPYCEAVLLETMRIGVLIPFLLPHAATRDTHFQGYKIRKGTMIMMNMFAISRDPQLWDEPCQFKPDRYLIKKGSTISIDGENNANDDGKDVEFVVNRDLTDRFPAFGLGQRRCVGELLGRTEAFIVAMKLIQKLQFSLIPGQEYSTEAIFSLALDPKPYSLIIKPVD